MINKLFKKKYRIVRDNYSGYEVQHKYCWWPFWVETNTFNTHYTVEDAETFIKKVSRSGSVVKVVG